jgi:hypothetical protein
MTTYSQTDWATRALQKASIVDAEEAPSAALSAWAGEVGVSLFEQLAAESISVSNGSDQSLPGEYYQVFSAFVACDLKAEVGLISDVEAETLKTELKKTFRRMNPLPATGSVVEVEYF